MTKSNIGFLTPGIRQIRKSIIDIDDSYNNEWDILAELCQNSVDAIRATGRSSGQIKILVDATTHTIEVEDDGIGIEPDDLETLLKPFSTNKDMDESAIGEKGVGLTFAMFSCNDFTIRSGTSKGAAQGHVEGAREWKSRTDESPLTLSISSVDSFRGTKITLKDIEDDSTIFTWTRRQLAFVLRTRTAIGTTNSIWGEPLDIRVELRHRSIGQRDFEDSLIPFRYFLPTEDLSSEATIDIAEFVKWAADADRTDSDKRRKLRDRAITLKKTFTHRDNREIKAFACYVPSRQTWQTLSKKAYLATDEQLANSEWLDNFSYTQLNPGIFTSVKGMPTGIEISPPSTGYAGYWSNFFILFEDQSLRFDIGRKSIHGKQANIYRKYAHEIFNDFLKVVTRYVSGELDERSWNREEAFTAIETMADLALPRYSLVKTPKDQEAGVAALFFEAIGKCDIQGITPLTTGYRNKYDLYAKVGPRKVVIEFKSRLSGLTRDFNDTRKMFDEIDAVVAWGVSEDDVEKFRTPGIELTRIRTGLSGASPEFPHATHELRLPNVHPIYVIDLKEVLVNAGQ